VLIGPLPLEEIPVQPDIVALAIGVFDGVHLGHQAVIRQLSQVDGPRAVLTFDPHPLSIIAPERAPSRIITLAQKAKLLVELGVNRMITLQFDLALKNSTAEFFCDQLIRIAPTLKFVAVGDSWVFGVNRRGNVPQLKEWASSKGIQVVAVSHVDYLGSVVSSTRIRELINQHNFQLADTLLGWSFGISGTVIHGEARGRMIGFPTANLADVPQLIPPRGTYAVQVRIGSLPERHVAVFNHGLRPTVSNSLQPSLEAHILDFSGDLYGQNLTLDHFNWLRDEQKFASLQALKDQIAADVERARALFHAV
jgi:riboflavin kinase/FMN adenylyltransferase